MKFSAISITLFAAVVSAAGSTLDVASALSVFYASKTLSISPAESTSLASALVAVETSWEASPEYTSAYNAILSAAPSSLQASISQSGYNVEDFTTEAWYTKSVPTAVQTAIASNILALDSAAEKILGTATSTSKGGAERTVVPVLMGVVGLLAAVL